MRIWGIDLGTTSIGFAVIDHDPARESGRIHRLGVRIFPEGVTEDKKEPRNKTRRTKRLMRRGIRRRKLRRRLLNEALSASGLLPRYGTAEWNTAVAQDPYELRREGLTRALLPDELGRAIYHLAKRRGFAGRAAEEKKTDPDEMAATADAQKLAAEKGGRTLGAFLAGQPKKRGRHHTRDMVRDEFDKLWSAQQPHHPVLNNPQFEARIRNLVFFQRPTFWRLKTLSKCQFCPGDPPEPKGSWAGQQFLVLEQLTKLRIAGANNRPLSAEEFSILLAQAHRQRTISWGGVRKALRKHWQERDEDEYQRFNMEVSGAETGIKGHAVEDETGIKGHAVEYEMRKVFGDAWDSHPKREDIRRDLHQHLWTADYLQVGNSRVEIRRDEDVKAKRRKARAWMQQNWGLTDEQAEALAKLDLPPAWLGWSRTAIAEMLPLMAQGHSVGDLTRSPDWQSWREQTFPDRNQPTGEIRDRLPSHPRSMPEVRNPTVHRTLNELRKVVNNLLAAHGRPDLIRVELTRDLKESKSRRSERLSRNKKQEAERKKAIADLEKNGIANPGRDDIEKWLLWKESNERCPYSGDHVGFEALFREGKYQVEHIWPRSRSLDNSFPNKTLCRTDINILKGNRTPHQVWGSDPEAWHRLKQTISECKLPEYKVRRFMKADIAGADGIDEAGSDAFSQRQLADTGWAAREARDFLKRLWPDTGTAAPVETVNGRITAQLRHQWALNAILNPDGETKTRDDHRHHAVDALAVALTSRSFVKRLSDWHRQRKTGVRPPEFRPPWRELFAEAKAKIQEVVVSHKTRRKVSGALHAETVVGDTGQDEKTKSGTYRLFVMKKAVERLSKSEITTIRDPVIRDLVAKHVAERGGDPKKAFPPYPRLPAANGKQGPEIRRVRLWVKQQLNLMVPVGTGYADAAANHHIVVYRDAKGGIDFEVVSLHEAARRIASHKQVTSRVAKDGAAFVLSLSAGDTLAFRNGGSAPRFRIVQSIWSSGQIVMLDHTDASKETKNQPGIASIVGSGAQKVSVDPIGRVRPARD
ncbi:MAG: type II CRISPR RNA-guided endonuclease Cas9 [Pseudolabrys sp.]